MAPDDQTFSARALPWALTAAVIIAATIVALQWRSDSLSPLDPDRLDARRTTWFESRIVDYDLALRVKKDRLPVERYEVSVRDGKLASEKLDGRPVVRGSISPWTVDGIFNTIEDTVALESGGTARLRAEFHPQLGFPTAFRMLTTEAGKRSYAITIESLTVPSRGVVYQAD